MMRKVERVASSLTAVQRATLGVGRKIMRPDAVRLLIQAALEARLLQRETSAKRMRAAHKVKLKEQTSKAIAAMAASRRERRRDVKSDAEPVEDLQPAIVDDKRTTA